MAKNIVICCDGTNNQFGPQNTSVVRLVQVADRNPARQHVYYDPGVGTLPEPGVVTAAAKRISEIIGLAFGAGLSWKVQEAYEYLMGSWEPGDRVYIFGFSRGAYTARVLAAMLHSLGLLPRGNVNLVPYAMRLFKAIRNQQHGDDQSSASAFFTLCEAFRWTFALATPEDPDGRRFHVHFLGVWDTVSSVGWARDPPRFPFSAKNPSVGIIRHAVSIDERRWFFRQNRMFQAREGQDLKELWFPGVHSDVGGGYPDSEGGLWRRPFRWILDEAHAAGLEVDPIRLEKVLSLTSPSTEPCDDPQHESLKGAWWLAEFFPKLQWNADTRSRRIAFGLGRHRAIHQGALLSSCALRRLRDAPAYRPPNLSPEFVEAVRRLPDVPGFLPYAPNGDIAGQMALATALPTTRSS